MDYQNNYICPTGVKNNCDTCNSCPQPKPACPKPCPTPVQQCIPVCTEGRVGISANSGGLADMFAVGLGREDFVSSPDGTPTGANYIPWFWLDPAMFPQNSGASFVDKVYTRCDGTTIRTEGRNKINIISPGGDVLATYTNPFSLMSGAGAARYRVVDSSTSTDSIVTVPGGDITLVEAGAGIDIVPVFGTAGAPSGFRIINTSLSTNTIITPQVNSGITIIGSGTLSNPYIVGISCATLASNCGLVKSVNGQAPDSNGNVSISTSGGGLSGLISPDNSVLISAGSSGVLNLVVNDDQVVGRSEYANNGALVGTRRRLNFIAGSNVTIGMVDDNVNNKVDVTINATGGGGAGVTTNTLTVAGSNLVSTVNGIAASVPLSSLGSGTGSNVQYQNDNINTGVINPTTINFTGAANATQVGSVVTVDVPPALSTMGGGIGIFVDRIGSLPAGSNVNTSMTTTFQSVYGVNNGSPANYTVSGNNLTVQPGRYLVQVQADFEVDTDSGTVNTVYVFDADASFNLGSTFGAPFTSQNVTIHGGGNNNSSQTATFDYVTDIVSATTVNLSTATQSFMSRISGYSTTQPTTLLTTFKIALFKLS